MTTNPFLAEPFRFPNVHGRVGGDSGNSGDCGTIVNNNSKAWCHNNDYDDNNKQAAFANSERF